METIKSNYALIDEKTGYIILHPKLKTSSNLTELKDVEIYFIEDYIKVIAKQLKWGFTYYKEFLETTSGINNKYIKFGYRNLKDRFNRTKYPYVDGYYLLDETKHFEYYSNVWKIRHAN